MAIKKIFKPVDDGNFYKTEFKDAYCKIDMLQIDPVKNNIRMGVRTYIDENSRRENAMGIYKQVYNLTFDEIQPASYSKDDILTACYEYIKTLPEFEDGEDA